MLPPAIGGQIRVAGLGLCRSWGAHSVPYWQIQAKGMLGTGIYQRLRPAPHGAGLCGCELFAHIFQPVEVQHVWQEEAAKIGLNTICKYALFMCLVS